jgi:Phospholipase_D-nuclease N-terminal
MDVTQHPFLHVLWTGFLLFILVAWIWVVVMVFVDNFRRTDHSGWAKAMWTIFIIFVPIIGVLSYMIVRPPDTEYR